MEKIVIVTRHHHHHINWWIDARRLLPTTIDFSDSQFHWQVAAQLRLRTLLHSVSHLPPFIRLGVSRHFSYACHWHIAASQLQLFPYYPLLTLPSFATYAQYMFMRNIFLRAAFLLASAVTFLERSQFMPLPFSSREYPLETNSHTLAISNEQFDSQFC